MGVTIDYPETDDELYCHYPTQGNPQRVKLSLDLEDGRLRAYYWAEIGSGVSGRAHCSLDVEWSIPPLTIQGFSYLVEQIKTDLETILEGSDVKHDGSNYVGVLSEEAHDAKDRIEEVIDRFVMNSCDDGDIYTVWQADDWFVDFDASTVITAKSTDLEIVEIAETMTLEAEGDGYHVEGIEEYLLRERDELADERVQEENMLELRSKPTVEAGITYKHRCENGSMVVTYQPGDGSVYRLILSSLELPDEGLEQLGLSTSWPNILVTLANNPARPEGSMITHQGARVAYAQVGACFGVGLPSSITLAELIAYLIDGEAMTCNEAQQRFVKGTL